MARRKPKNIYPVKDNKEANTVLGEIALLKRQIEAKEATMNDEIDRIKALTEAETAPLITRLNSLENGLMAYAEFNYDTLFAEKKTREYDFGRLGYRISTEIRPQPKTTVAQVLGKVKELGFTQAIRIKESLNKDELHAWPTERLDLVGARRMVKDTFWYEIKEEEINAQQ